MSSPTASNSKADCTDFTEGLKKVLLSYSITDNSKARDAGASEKDMESLVWTVILRSEKEEIKMHIRDQECPAGRSSSLDFSSDSPGGCFLF